MDLNIESHQSGTTGLESAQVVVPQSFTLGTSFCDLSGGNDSERSTATHEVRLLVAVYCAYAHGFGQVPKAIVDDIQDAEESMSNINFIPDRAETIVNAIGTADTAIVHFDTISSTYLQPLNTFNAIVTGIANVRHSK